jgi:bifunctional non-homologous end joining protein LigD
MDIIARWKALATREMIMPRKDRNSSIDLHSLPAAKLTFIEPMLAKLTNHLPETSEWFYEIKLDGYRALAVKRAGRVTLYSRRGNKLNARFPAIAKAFDFLPDKTAVDGEVVALDDHGRPSFSTLQNSLTRGAALYFYAFDLVACESKDVRRLPLNSRRELLTQLVAKATEPIRMSASFADSPQRLITAVKKSGLEGIVAKRANSFYESGERTGAWVKYKTNRGQELVVGGYKPGTNGFEYLLVGYYEGRDLIFVAKVKNGFTTTLRRKVAERFRGLETVRCPFANLPELKNARRGEALTAEVMQQMRWLKPKLVAQIEFTEWTKANHLRHSKFVALRDDKKPREVHREASL